MRQTRVWKGTRIGVLGASLGFLGVQPAAGQVFWTDWVAATRGLAGAASGILNVGSSSVFVNYAGEIFFGQTGCGTNYWNPSTPYTSPGVNAPPPCDMIALIGGNSVVNTITFSVPVLNPFMAIVSLGQPSVIVDYVFNAPFTVLSHGPGYWGGPGTLTALPGNVLRGVEGHGTIRFNGTFSSISWTVPTAENWHGFTVGAAGLAVSTIPEPVTSLLLGTGLAAVAAAARRRRRKERAD